MQKCENCNIPFQWRVIYRSLMKSYKPITCLNCHTNHEVAISSRFIVTGLTVIPMMIFILVLSPLNHFFMTMAIGVVIAIMGSLVTPFIVKYNESKD